MKRTIIKEKPNTQKKKNNYTFSSDIFLQGLKKPAFALNGQRSSLGGEISKLKPTIMLESKKMSKGLQGVDALEDMQMHFELLTSSEDMRKPDK